VDCVADVVPLGRIPPLVVERGPDSLSWVQSYSETHVNTPALRNLEVVHRKGIGRGCPPGGIVEL
jgi:hypothetical protein